MRWMADGLWRVPEVVGPVHVALRGPRLISSPVPIPSEPHISSVLLAGVPTGKD